jgi:hypothetical protein
VRPALFAGPRGIGRAEDVVVQKAFTGQSPEAGGRLGGFFVWSDPRREKENGTLAGALIRCAKSNASPPPDGLASAELIGPMAKGNLQNDPVTVFIPYRPVAARQKT